MAVSSAEPCRPSWISWALSAARAAVPHQAARQDLRVGEHVGDADGHGDDETGAQTLFVMERRNDARTSFALTTRAPLDVEGFRGAEWTTENADLDGDGLDEVLCTGTISHGYGSEPARRYLVYVPRTRETYSLHLAPDSTGAHALRATWSPNTQGWDARLFRHALRQRAFN